MKLFTYFLFLGFATAGAFFIDVCHYYGTGVLYLLIAAGWFIEHYHSDKTKENVNQTKLAFNDGTEIWSGRPVKYSTAIVSLEYKDN
jgi:hypothetical protein